MLMQTSEGQTGEMNAGVRGGLASSITRTTTILGVVIWCDGTNVTSMHHVIHARWGGHIKGSENDWLYDFKEEMSPHQISSLL